ncbi:unnamed protein product [Brassica napus]|uniref:(rape) hypothetical protein n=1 Tax=Brassica napus TaxID=3708 RepID=A0A816L733_BRANA|nr:unnamed protein product [Brassica napus]
MWFVRFDAFGGPWFCVSDRTPCMCSGVGLLGTLFIQSKPLGSALSSVWYVSASFVDSSLTLRSLAKDETILVPAAEYRKCHSSLARENFGDFPGSRKTRVINFVVLPALGAVGESSPAIIRPQTTPAVMKKSNLSQTTIRRRARSSGEELPERPPAKQQRYPDMYSGSEDGSGGASRCTLPELYEAHRMPPQPTARSGSQNHDALLTDLMQERSAPEGGEGHQKWVGAPPVGYESGQTSNQNDGEGLEQVSAPMGFVEALVKEINSEIPGADEEIRATRGGERAQPKENESVAARMTPTGGIDFVQKTGDDNGGESGQTSNQNDGERLEQVSAPMGFVEALVKEINSEIPGADEEIRATRGGEGAQPKENKFVAARMTPTAGIGFAQKTGGDNGGEFVEEDPDGGEEARTADKQPQSVDSVETSNMEFPKPVEAVGKVAPPKAGGEASVKEINAELQGTEDEERYDSCKDDMSTDSQIQVNPRDLCGETDADSEEVGSGGKRHRMRSSKISGVYTPGPRVKKLFKSEEKVEYKPIAKTNRTQFKKFAEILRENPEQMWDIATGHSVCNHFFLEIAEPGKWMSDEHMHVIMNMLWRRRGIYLQKERMVILDQYFIKTIQSNWSAFSTDNDKLQFEWGKNVAQYVTGKSKGQKMKLGLGRDVDTVYTPMNWGGDHWVGLCIKLTEGHVTVFDSYVPHTEIEVKEGLRIYSWSRAEGIYHNKGVATVGHVLPSS